MGITRRRRSANALSAMLLSGQLRKQPAGSPLLLPHKREGSGARQDLWTGGVRIFSQLHLHSFKVLQDSLISSRSSFHTAEGLSLTSLSATAPAGSLTRRSRGRAILSVSSRWDRACVGELDRSLSSDPDYRRLEPVFCVLCLRLLLSLRKFRDFTPRICCCFCTLLSAGFPRSAASARPLPTF